MTVADHTPSSGDYDPASFPPFAVTVDIVVLSVSDQLDIAVVERGVAPHRGALALPGGFVHADEDVTTAAWRELVEETGLDGAALGHAHLEQLATYGAVDRDPRMRVVSVAHLALVATRPPLTAGTDAAAARWVPVADVLAGPVAFDHAAIITDAVERLRAKLEYTTLATALAGETFTLGELQRVYEVVWGCELQRANFRRKILATDGYVIDTGAYRPGSTGGPRARVYRPGTRAELPQPLLRPA